MISYAHSHRSASYISHLDVIHYHLPLLSHLRVFVLLGEGRTVVARDWGGPRVFGRCGPLGLRFRGLCGNIWLRRRILLAVLLRLGIGLLLRLRATGRGWFLSTGRDFERGSSLALAREGHAHRLEMLVGLLEQGQHVGLSLETLCPLLYQTQDLARNLRAGRNLGYIWGDVRHSCELNQKRHEALGGHLDVERQLALLHGECQQLQRQHLYLLALLNKPVVEMSNCLLRSNLPGSLWLTVRR